MRVRGGPSEKAVNEARRQRLADISHFLRGSGYYVSWGWEEVSGDPDTSFIAVGSSPTRPDEAEPEPQIVRAEHLNEVQEKVQKTPSENGYPEDLRTLLISMPEIEETVAEIFRAHNSGRDQDARRIEHKLYQQVLLGIVGGVEENPRHMAAAALITQHLSFPR